MVRRVAFEGLPETEPWNIIISLLIIVYFEIFLFHSGGFLWVRLCLPISIGRMVIITLQRVGQYILLSFPCMEALIPV